VGDEEFGGDESAYSFGTQRNRIDELLEMILLVAEVQDIRANPNRPQPESSSKAKLEKNTGRMRHTDTAGNTKNGR